MIPNLTRKLEQYANCTPEAVVGGSEAQMRFFVADAKADIATLASALEAAEARIASVRDESVEECARVVERMAEEQEYRNRKYPRHFKSYPSWAQYPWHYRQAATAIRALRSPPAPKQESA